MDYIPGLPTDKLKYFGGYFRITFKYICMYDIISLNNYKLYITTYFINIYYPSEIKENGDQDVRYICIFIYLESCKKRQSSSNIYGKRDDFSCSIVNFSCFLFIYPPDMAFTYPN